MKTKLFNNSKWYIFGIIAVVLVLSIGLSFCVWDNNNLLNVIEGTTANSKVGVYKLSKDNDENGAASVGDIIEFGEYYQDADGKIKTELEWRIVDIRTENKKEVMYLLTEYAVASGVFFQNGLYYDIDNKQIRAQGYINNNCYNDSTVRAWLNSDLFGEARKDGEIGFTNPPIGSDRVFYGFYNEAFSQGEKNAIVARDFVGMSGYSYYINQNKGKVTYPNLSGQKVWIPSTKEVGGDSIGTDSVEDKQFSYFSDNNKDKRLLYPTKFNKVNNGEIISNYSFAGMPATSTNVGGNINPDGALGWMLRSAGDYSTHGSMVRINGDLHWGLGNYDTGAAIRPGICILK